MDILETVRKSGILGKYRHVILGLSGGPDSVCLFDVLLRLREEGGPEIWPEIWPVHVNHMLRPGDADQDQAYVEALCEQHGLPLKVVRFDCTAMAREQGLTSEEAGRIVRYKAFRDMAREVQVMMQTRGDAAALEKSAGHLPSGPIAIALAHHADDQAETILYRIIRGTGTDGLAGMEPVREDESGFDVIRPLLGVRRADIEAYCRERGLHPCIDHTNNQPVYARNRIRLELLPLMEQYNPRVVEALNRLGSIAAEDKAFLDFQTAAAAARHRLCAAAAPPAQDSGSATPAPGAPPTPAPGAPPTPAPSAPPTPAPGAPRHITFRLTLLEEHPAVSRRVLAGALEELGLTEDLTHAHFQAMLTLGGSDRASAQVDLPHGYTARKEYDRIVLLAPSEKTRDSTFQIRVMPAAEYRSVCEASTANKYAAFDYDLLADRYGTAPEERIRWRSRRPGDVLPIRGGRKKLQDVFVDDKVSRFRRDEVQLAAIGNEVLWIPVQEGLMRRDRYAAGCGVTDGTERVLWIGEEYRGEL